ncbi:MAG TPA: LON peptidase substrate-binding domain-containing protein [Actinomycetota bacterium]|nr:LON peptidase substrate-binding domain-containing protein [Actinomycetota bacterium]
MESPAEEIGLFPLGIALVPGEQLALHIFEPRYRELIGECLDTSRPFGFIYQHEGRLCPVGTRATVIDVLRRYDDGRLDIMVRGRERFRLVELTSGRSFITATVTDLEDTPEAPTAEELAACREAWRQAALAGDSGEPDRDAFGMAALLELPAPLKQELLELRSERARVLRLTRELAGDLGAELRANEIGRRAAANGKVVPGKVTG